MMTYFLGSNPVLTSISAPTFDLSSNAIEVMQSMLVASPNRRPSASELLSHKWFGHDSTNVF